MKENTKVFLQWLGIIAGCVVLVLVVINMSWVQHDEARRAEVKELEAKLQVLRDQNTRIEAERAGEKAVREYDTKHASLEELHRMEAADLREIERLNAIIRVEKERQ